MADHLPSPRDETQPLILTREQALLVVEWYALDHRGDRLYRRAIIEMAKGWGKSPLAGAIAIAELAGPVVFDGWDVDGNPVGRPWGTGGAPPALVQIAAVSEDQADNTYGSIFSMLSARGGKVAESIGVDDGRTRLYLSNRPGELRPVTASAGSREGQRVTFAVLDETHLWRQDNGGVKLAATIRRNAAKMNGRTFETSNAPQLGENSVAERSGSEASRYAGILHYAKRPADEPQPDWTDAELLSALNAAYGDAWWVDRERLIRDIRDPGADWDDSLRYFFSVRRAGTGKAVDPRRWDELAQYREVPDSTPIGIGFDGSNNRDVTALRGCTADGYSFILGAWVRPKDAPLEWAVPRSDVDEAVDRAFQKYRVGRMLCDPWRWQTDIERWVERYGAEVVAAFDVNQARRFAPAVDRWRTAIADGTHTHTHDGDPLTADHVKAAHLKKLRPGEADDDGRTRYVIVKGEDRRKIDAAVADVLAYEAAMTMPEPTETRGPVLW